MVDAYEALEQLRAEGYAITIESSPGEDWSVSITPIEFHPETEYPPMRWQATDEWCGYGSTLQAAIDQALECKTEAME